MVSLQQIIDERISFLKEQINPNNKPEVNSTFQIQIDAIIRSAAAVDIEKVESIILQKKALQTLPKPSSTNAHTHTHTNPNRELNRKQRIYGIETT
jgi:hypothetical protein